MKKNIFRRLDLILLFIILSAALALRLLGIDFGLPYVFYPDETVIVNHAVAFGTGDLNPHYFIYPSLYMYVMSIIYGFTYVVGWLTGIFTSTADFARLFFNDVTLFYLPGRLISALCGVASVAMVYLLGRRAYNIRVGLISASFLAFSVYHVEYSHFLKTHVPAGLLVIIGLYMAVSIYNDNCKDNLLRYIFCGAVAGLATSTIYHAGFVLISMVLACMLHRHDSLTDDDKMPKIIIMVIACFVFFILGTPFALLDWSSFIRDITAGASMSFKGGFWERGTFYPFTSLLATMGSPLGFVSLLGMGYALLRHRPVDLILVSQPLLLAGFLMLFAVKQPHHMLIAFPALSILGALFVADIIGFLIRPRILKVVTLVLVTVLILINPTIISFQSSYRLTLPDTRELSKNWIEANINPGSKIVMDSGKYYPGSFGPPIRYSKWTLEQFIARAETVDKKSLPRIDGGRIIGYTGEAEYFRQYLKAVDSSKPSYDVVQILHNEGSQSTDILTLDEYISMGVQYAIVSSKGWSQYETSSRYPDKAEKYRDFYQALESHTILLKEFKSSEKIVGPTLRIYKLTSSSSIRN